MESFYGYDISSIIKKYIKVCGRCNVYIDRDSYFLCYECVRTNSSCSMCGKHYSTSCTPSLNKTLCSKQCYTKWKEARIFISSMNSS